MYKFSLKAELLEEPSLQLKDSNSVVSYLRNNVYNLDTLDYIESMYAIVLNRAMYVVGYFPISTGGTTATIADVKYVCLQALQTGGHSIIITHNHPSQNLTLSSADIKITEKLKKGLGIIDIELIDHIVVTKSHHTSMADKGLITNM